MSGEKDHLRGEISFRQRYFCGCRRCERCSYSRHNFEIDSRFTERFHLLTCAAEERWVAALEANYRLSLLSGGNHTSVNLFLRDSLSAAALPYVLDERGGMN